MTAFAIRPVRDQDGDELRDILAGVFAEYDGCFFVRSELPELEAPATSFAALDGKLWVAEENGRILGLVAIVPTADPALVELRKLYTRREARGRGLGGMLIDLVENEARARGASRVHLWTDTRFETAHRVYEHRGYVRLPETRELHDASASIEYHYEKAL